MLQKPKCERTNWNRKICRWQIAPNQRLFPYARCQAKNELATATQNILINDHILRIEHLTPDKVHEKIEYFQNMLKSKNKTMLNSVFSIDMLF